MYFVYDELRRIVPTCERDHMTGYNVLPTRPTRRFHLRLLGGGAKPIPADAVVNRNHQ